jgi:sirohydrochlorin cobaltochelatase
MGPATSSPFSDDALLLIGHGSARYADAGGILQEHARALRAAGHFASVAVGLLSGLPPAREILDALTAPVVHVVPFFMESGYFSRVAVPNALGLVGRVTPRNGRVLRYCAPVGTHDGMAALIEARVLRHCPDPAAWTVVLVGHGSARAPGRRLALHRHASRLQHEARFARVEFAFLEEPPLVPQVLAGLARQQVAVVGVFAGEGVHARDDLPEMLAAEKRRRGRGGPLLADLGPVSAEPGMRSIILDQVADAADGVTAPDH